VHQLNIIQSKAKFKGDAKNRILKHAYSPRLHGQHNLGLGLRLGSVFDLEIFVSVAEASFAQLTYRADDWPPKMAFSTRADWPPG